jgi:hypothetical protein
LNACSTRARCPPHVHTYHTYDPPTHLCRLSATSVSTCMSLSASSFTLLHRQQSVTLSVITSQAGDSVPACMSLSASSFTLLRSGTEAARSCGSCLEAARKLPGSCLGCDSVCQHRIAAQQLHVRGTPARQDTSILCYAMATTHRAARTSVRELLGTPVRTSGHFHPSYGHHPSRGPDLGTRTTWDTQGAAAAYLAHSHMQHQHHHQHQHAGEGLLHTLLPPSLPPSPCPLTGVA